MKTTRQKIEIMEAYLNGVNIEFKSSDIPEWQSLTNSDHINPVWDWRNTYYRISRKSIILNIKDDGTVKRYNSIGDAKNDHAGYSKIAVKYGEVI